MLKNTVFFSFGESISLHDDIASPFYGNFPHFLSFLEVKTEVLLSFLLLNGLV